jgi:hypothetical protein
MNWRNLVLDMTKSPAHVARQVERWVANQRVATLNLVDENFGLNIIDRPGTNDRAVMDFFLMLLKQRVN